MVERWGAPGDIPVPGFEGCNGESSFAVWRPTTGDFRVRLVQSPGVFQDNIFHLGQYGDIPVADTGVWRPTTGQWFRFGGGEPIRWGQWGDVPV
jgi:hypothetical protein